MDELQHKQNLEEEDEVTVKGKPAAIIGVGSPFTDQDIRKLQYESKLSSDDKNWKLFKTTKVGEVWRKTSADSSRVQKMKGSLLFPGIPPTAVLELITNFKLRLRWEKQFEVFEILEECDDYKIIYWRVKTPKGTCTTDRDFVMYITHGINSDGVFYVLYKNASHPKKPEIPGVIRAENIFSGALIYPDSSNDSTKVFILAEDDLKGSIPKMILNSFYTKAPLHWRDNLYNFYHKIYKHEQSLS